MPSHLQTTPTHGTEEDFEGFQYKVTVEITFGLLVEFQSILMETVHRACVH